MRGHRFSSHSARIGRGGIFHYDGTVAIAVEGRVRTKAMHRGILRRMSLDSVVLVNTPRLGFLSGQRTQSSHNVVFAFRGRLGYGPHTSPHTMFHTTSPRPDDCARFRLPRRHLGGPLVRDIMDMQMLATPTAYDPWRCEIGAGSRSTSRLSWSLLDHALGCESVHSTAGSCAKHRGVASADDEPNRFLVIASIGRVSFDFFPLWLAAAPPVCLHWRRIGVSGRKDGRRCSRRWRQSKETQRALMIPAACMHTCKRSLSIVKDYRTLALHGAQFCV